MTNPYAPPNQQLAVEIAVGDLQASLAFYQRVGFQLVRDEGGFAELTWPDGGSVLMLEQVAGQPQPPATPVANLRILVPDVDAYRTIAEEMGAAVLIEIADRDYGLRDFTMAGPDGIALRFASRLPDRA
jgi:catechol 2,3-dioxygenase-like lactoylglutathione lyase family enzyme